MSGYAGGIEKRRTKNEDVVSFERCDDGKSKTVKLEKDNILQAMNSRLFKSAAKVKPVRTKASPFYFKSSNNFNFGSIKGSDKIGITDNELEFKLRGRKGIQNEK